MAERERSRSPDPATADKSTEGAEAPAPAENGENGDTPAPASTPASEAGAGDEGSVKLYVGNLDYATDEQKLRDEFSQFGTVTDVFLPTEKGTQRPRGFGFVTLADRAAAEQAISKMDQSQLDGRTIRVNESRPKGSPREPGSGGGFNPSGREEVGFVAKRHDLICTR
jgi:RNA recognition motif-containing protein